MSVTLHYEPDGKFVRAKVAGSPTLTEFLEVLRQMGRDSAGWPQDMALIDLRGVVPVYSFTEQFTLGEEVARSLAHLRRFASVVPAGRVTRVSEKAASHRGVNVRVFDDDAEAVVWLLSE
jgi:hypothetical protein